MRERKTDETMPHDLIRYFHIMGNDMAAARKARKMTQEELAKKLNISRMTVHRLEKGDHRVSFGIVASAAWVMGLEKNIMNAFAPENDLYAIKMQRQSLPDRVKHSKPEINMEF